MVGREVHEPGAPLAIPEGEADLPGLWVEMKRLGIGSEEQAPDIRGSRAKTLAQASAVSLGEGEGDVGGDDGMLTGEVVDEGAVAGEARERATGRLVAEQRFPEYLVGQESVVGHEGEDRGW